MLPWWAGCRTGGKRGWGDMAESRHFSPETDSSDMTPSHAHTMSKSCHRFAHHPVAEIGTYQSFETDLSNGAFSLEQTVAALI